MLHVKVRRHPSFHRRLISWRRHCQDALSVMLSGIVVALFDTMYRSVGTGRLLRRCDRAQAPVTSRAFKPWLQQGGVRQAGRVSES